MTGVLSQKHQARIFLHPIICIYILLGMKPDRVPNLPCLCASLRRASRALNQLYEDSLRPLGLSGSQFTILQTLSLAGEVSQGALGQMLAMDSTTLTRTLAIMSRHGWIARRPGEDRRVTLVRLSDSGKAQFGRALPYWEGVQARVKSKLGRGRWDDLMSLSNNVTRMVAEQTSQSSETNA
jgi:DNA-binding MarR family transcriptional regulator